MAWWVCYVGARGTCGGRCGVVRQCSGRHAVWSGCGVWPLAGSRIGWWFFPPARFGLWPLVGIELAHGVWGFQGCCRGVGVRSRRGAVSFPCWWAAVSHVPGWGRGVRCRMVALGCVLAFPLGGGGHRVQVWSGEWLLAAGPQAVRGSPARSPGRPSGVFQSVGDVESLQWATHSHSPPTGAAPGPQHARDAATHRSADPKNVAARAWPIDGAPQTPGPTQRWADIP